MRGLSIVTHIFRCTICLGLEFFFKFGVVLPGVLVDIFVSIEQTYFWTLWNDTQWAKVLKDVLFFKEIFFDDIWKIGANRESSFWWFKIEKGFLNENLEFMNFTHYVKNIFFVQKAHFWREKLKILSIY